MVYYTLRNLVKNIPKLVLIVISHTSETINMHAKNIKYIKLLIIDCPKSVFNFCLFILFPFSCVVVALCLDQVVKYSNVKNSSETNLVVD